MIEVIRKGISISIQDLGRYGKRRYGVPIGGVMDRQSAILANGLIGNKIDSALIEIYMPGHQFRFNEQVSICLCGAIGDYHINGKDVVNNKVKTVDANDTLSIGKMKVGCWLYLALNRPIVVRNILGSYSSLKSVNDTQLKRNGTIELGSLHREFWQNSGLKSSKINQTECVVAYRGPEFELLDTKAKTDLLSQPFQISTTLSRMGYRISGEKLKSYHPFSLLSAAVMPGTVQLLPNGLPLILMRDCATTGGYPRVLQLTEKSINQVAQKKPGDTVVFQLVKS